MKDIGMKSYQVAHRIFLISFMVISVICGVFALCVYKDFVRGIAGILATGIPLLLPIIRKALKISKATQIEIIVIIFAIFAFHFGVVAGGYAVIGVFDNVMHGLSGVIFTMLGMCTGWLARDKRISVENGFDYNFNLHAFFGVCFAQFCSVIWETFEFAGFLIFGHDAQHSLTTGVADTMSDLILCFVGALLWFIVLIIVRKVKPKSVIFAPLREFYELNG